MKTFIKTHNNFKYIYKPNGGVSSARNLGLELAQGKYIMFIDADDYLSRCGGIDLLTNLAIQENADVVKFKSRYVRNASVKSLCEEDVSKYEYKTYNGRAQALKYYNISDYVVWDGLYKRSIIEDNHIRFKEDLCLHEDDVFMSEIFSNCYKCLYVDIHLYRYICESANSSTHRQNIERQRLLIKSSINAIIYRKQAIVKYLNDMPLPLERYKYMRYVFDAFNRMHSCSYYTKDKFINIVKIFIELDCYPLSYKWIHIAQKKYTFKIIVKTFLYNHPNLLFVLKKFK